MSAVLKKTSRCGATTEVLWLGEQWKITECFYFIGGNNTGCHSPWGPLTVLCRCALMLNLNVLGLLVRLHAFQEGTSERGLVDYFFRTHLWLPNSTLLDSHTCVSLFLKAGKDKMLFFPFCSISHQCSHVICQWFCRPRLWYISNICDYTAESIIIIIYFFFYMDRGQGSWWLQ